MSRWARQFEGHKIQGLQKAQSYVNRVNRSCMNLCLLWLRQFVFHACRPWARGKASRSKKPATANRLPCALGPTRGRGLGPKRSSDFSLNMSERENRGSKGPSYVSLACNDASLELAERTFRELLPHAPKEVRSG